MTLSNSSSKVYAALRELGVDPYITSLIPLIKVSKVGGVIVYDTNDFEAGLDTAIEEGFVKDMLVIGLGDGENMVYRAAVAAEYYGTDQIYYNLSNSNFVTAFGGLYDKYIELCTERNVEAVFFLRDEPRLIPKSRIEVERLYTMRYTDQRNATIAVTYHTECDLPLDPGSYITPTDYNGTNDDRIPPLTNKADLKMWTLSHEGAGYDRHHGSDAAFPDYPSSGFGYYTTYHSNMRNPIYNRFLHGLFAFGTDAKIVYSYIMGFGINDPYNDFDPAANYIFPFTYPDFQISYPTWDGNIMATGAFEGVREGITDARYIATLQKLIGQDPNLAVAAAAQEYLGDLKDRIQTDYSQYYGVTDNSLNNDLGYYGAILNDVSGTSDPNKFESFTGIRQDLWPSTSCSCPTMSRTPRRVVGNHRSRRRSMMLWQTMRSSCIPEPIWSVWTLAARRSRFVPAIRRIQPSSPRRLSTPTASVEW